MKKLQSFTRTSLLGGLVVILPVAILIFIFNWIFSFITNLIQPLTTMIMSKSQLREIVADAIVVTIIVLICFSVGIVVRTRFGKLFHKFVENTILNVFPGYSTIKEIVLQFLGTKKSPFSTVALVDVFGTGTLVTGFVTDEHETGQVTVFVPTSPNPTSGFIYHVKREAIKKIDVPVEQTMKSVISCGAGSGALIKAYQNAKNEKTE